METTAATSEPVNAPSSSGTYLGDDLAEALAKGEVHYDFALQFFVDAAKVKEIRAITGLSQPKFAKLLHVDVGTLRNWEQGRREPTGPAQALLRAIKNNPQAVLKALAA